MAELIDKERAYTALKHEQYTHGLSFSAEAFEKAARIIDQMPTIESEPVNRWISVEDALPEKDKSYITYAETTKYCNHNDLPEESRINILYFNGEEWYDEECRYYNVTHYMPLPELPEKE